MTDRRSHFRCMSDIRQVPLYIGIVQCLNATIPALDIHGSLFYSILHASGLGREFGWVLMLSGFYLIFGGLYSRRQSFQIALYISASLWTAMTIMLADAMWYPYTYMGLTQRWWTPITMSMPVTAFFLWFALFREMLLQPIMVRERRGHGDCRIGDARSSSH